MVDALLSRGLIVETTTDSRTKADAALNRIWRNDEDGCAILLHITDAERRRERQRERCSDQGAPRRCSLA